MSYLGKEESTPANPAATEHKFYFKADGMMYMLNSAGLEVQVVQGQGSPSGAMMIYMYNQFGGM